MLSWLAPDAVWKDRTVATGIPGGKDAASSPLVNTFSPLSSGVLGGTRSGGQVVAGPLAVDDPGEWLPKVTPTLDWPSVIRRTTEVWSKRWITCPTNPPSPTTGIADVDALVAALVDGDGGGEVRGVLLIVCAGHGRQGPRNGRFSSAVSWRSWAFSKLRSACAARELADGRAGASRSRDCRAP